MTHHHFEPHTYWNSFGSHPPVLRIRPGDTVITSTVDASGLDQLEQPAALGSNPETGPFYVEDAAPGDTLVVHLDALGPNRPTGWSRDVLAPHILEAGAVRGLPESAKVQWDIAPDGRTARLSVPPNRLDQVAFPLHPMLGCLGVAPEDDQAISSSTSGPYGGNMDYRGVTAAATLYFPVFVPGALLHLGDGHALQGDGEIVGTGIETSFKVQFTVGLLKNHPIRWPRRKRRLPLHPRQCPPHGASPPACHHRDAGLVAVRLRPGCAGRQPAVGYVRRVRGRQRLRPGLHPGL